MKLEKLNVKEGHTAVLTRVSLRLYCTQTNDGRRTADRINTHESRSIQAAGASAAPSDTTPSSRMPRAVTQATLRLSELQHAAARYKPLRRPSVRRHASLVAQHVGMAVPHVGRDIRSCRSVGSTVGHDAKLTRDSLSHAGNAETE